MESSSESTEGVLVSLSEAEQQAFNRLLTYYEGKNYTLHQKNCIKNYNYYAGKQYSKSKLDERKSKGQVTFKLNRMRRAINSFVGFKTAQRPKFLATPMGVSDEHITTIANNLFNWVDYNSNGMEQIREAVLNGDRDNIGYLHLYRDIMDNDKIKYRSLLFSDVVVDPQSRDSLYRDSENILIKKFVPVSRVKKQFGIEKLEVDTPVWWNKGIDSKDLADTTNELWEAEPLFDSSGSYVRLYESYHKELYRDENDKFRHKIKVSIYIGYKHRYDYYLPKNITEYPIFPFYADKSPNAYKTGEGYYLTELQDYMNDLSNALLDNALLTGDPRTYLSDAMVNGDFKGWMDDNKDNGNNYIIYPDKNMATPYTVGGQPLPSSFSNLYQMFSSEFDLALISKNLMGGDSTQNLRINELAEKREAAMESMRLSLSHLDSVLSHLGKVTLQYCQGFVPKDSILRYVDGENKAKDFRITRSKGLNVDNPNAVAQYVSQETERGRNLYEVQEEIDKAKDDKGFMDGLVLFYNPAENIDIDVKVISGSYSSSHNIHQFYSLLEMKQRGVMIDDAEIIKHAPIDSAHRIAKNSSTMRSLIGNNEQLKHELDEAREKINALLSSERGAKEQVVQEKTKARMTQMKTKAQNDVNTMKRKAQTDIGVAKSNLGNELRHVLEKSDIKILANEQIEKLKAVISELQNTNNSGTEESIGDFNIHEFLN